MSLATWRDRAPPHHASWGLSLSHAIDNISITLSPLVILIRSCCKDKTPQVTPWTPRMHDIPSRICSATKTRSTDPQLHAFFSTDGLQLPLIIVTCGRIVSRGPRQITHCTSSVPDKDLSLGQEEGGIRICPFIASKCNIPPHCLPVALSSSFGKLDGVRGAESNKGIVQLSTSCPGKAPTGFRLLGTPPTCQLCSQNTFLKAESRLIPCACLNALLLCNGVFAVNTPPTFDSEELD